MAKFNAEHAQQMTREACKRLREQKAIKREKQRVVDLKSLPHAIKKCKVEIKKAIEKGQCGICITWPTPSMWSMLADHFEKLGFHTDSYIGQLNHNTTYNNIKWEA